MLLRRLALGSSLEPVGDIACDDDRAGDEDGCRSDRAGADDKCNAPLIRTLMNGSHLNLLQNHVIGEDLAFLVVDLRGSRHIHAGLQNRDDQKESELQGGILVDGVLLGA
jgi:hypothetical protein